MLYVLFSNEPRSGAQEAFVTPRRRQALGSAIHCLAGDATGIIVAATITLALDRPMWRDAVSEYAFDLLVFQAPFTSEVLGRSYRLALRRSFLPE